MASSEDVDGLLVHTYDVDSLLDNDLYALYARIEFIQNHESQNERPFSRHVKILWINLKFYCYFIIFKSNNFAFKKVWISCF